MSACLLETDRIISLFPNWSKDPNLRERPHWLRNLREPGFCKKTLLLLLPIFGDLGALAPSRAWQAQGAIRRIDPNVFDPRPPFPSASGEKDCTVDRKLGLETILNLLARRLERTGSERPQTFPQPPLSFGDQS